MTAPTAAAAATDDRGYIRPELAHLAQPIRTYRPYPGNARRGNRQKIRDSLLTHGQYKPLIVQRSTGLIVAGNNTWHVMIEQGWSHAAFQPLELDDVAARKLLLMDNRSSDDASYDTAELADLLAELPELAGSGFANADLDKLFAELEGAGDALAALPSVEDVLPVSPAGPPIPDRPTADPLPVPVPDPIPVPPPVPPADPRTSVKSSHTAGVTPAPIKSPAEPHPAAIIQPDGWTRPPGVPDTFPRTELPPVPPVRRASAVQPPDADVTWPLALSRADRDEAHRLVAHARDWLADPALPPGDVVMRALRTLAAIGDARHNTTMTINITTLLMAAGRDPFTAA